MTTELPFDLDFDFDSLTEDEPETFDLDVELPEETDFDWLFEEPAEAPDPTQDQALLDMINAFYEEAEEVE